MKNYLLTLSTLLLLTLPGTRQLAATTRPASTAKARSALTPDEQLFTGLTEQLAAAIGKRDMQAMGQLMTSDYVHYSPDNKTAGRAEELAYVGQWVGTTVKQITPLKVTRRGDMAVTVATSTFSGEFEGKPFKNSVNMMIAWVLQDGRWQMAVVHSKVVKA